MDEKEKEPFDIESEFDIGEEMEQTFAKVVSELVSDRSLDRFRKEYESLHDALVQSHEHNTILMEKCRKLNNDIINNASKISSVLTLSQNDQRTIANLRMEFERAWTLVQASQAREERSREVIQNLNQEVTNLKYLVENTKKSDNVVSGISLQEAQTDVRILKGDIEVQESQVNNIIKQIDNARAETIKFENETFQLKNEYQNLLQESELVNNDYEQIETARADILNSCYKESDDIKSGNERSNEIKLQIQKQKRKIRTQKHAIEQYKKDKDILIELTGQVKHQLKNLKSRYEDIIALVNGVKARIKEKSNQIKNTEDTILDFENEIESLDYEKEEIEHELSETKEYRRLILNQKESDFERLKELRYQEVILRTGVNSVLLDIRQRNMDISRSTTEQREVKQRLLDEQAQTQIAEMQVHQIEQQCTQVKNDKHESGNKASEYCQEINRFEAQKFARESAAAIEIDNMIENKMRNEFINITLEKKNQEIKQKIEMYKDLQTERDKLVKEVKRVLKENEGIQGEILSQSNFLSSLKEGIRAKDESCVMVHISLKKTQKLVKQLSKQIVEVKEQLRQSIERGKEVYYRVLGAEHVRSQALVDIENAKHLIQRFLEQNRSIMKIFEEKKLEGERITEKCRVTQSLARIADHKYKQLMGKISSLKDELMFLVEKRDDLILQLRFQAAARNEIRRLEKDLFQARGQIRVMEDELETPRNVHRWHLLQSTNPYHYQLVTMRIGLVNSLTEQIAHSQRFKRRLENLREELEKLTRKLKFNKYDGESYDEEYQILSNVLREKSIQLKNMDDSRRITTDQANDESDIVFSVRCRLRAKRMKTIAKQKKINELMQQLDQDSGKVKVRPPKYKSSKRPPGRYLGGGFEVGRVVTEVRPPVEVKSSRKKTSTERLNAVLIPGPSTKKTGQNQNWGPIKNSSRRFPRD